MQEFSGWHFSLVIGGQTALGSIFADVVNIKVQSSRLISIVAVFLGSRDLTQVGREHQRERYRIIVLITKYNDFTWECNQLATFPSSSFGTEPEKLTFVVFKEREQQSMNHFNLHAASKLKFLIFYVHTATLKIK